MRSDQERAFGPELPRFQPHAADQKAAGAVPIFESNLCDGTPVLVRPVTPQDGDLLRMGMEHLSERSKRNRFFGAVSQLSEKRLASLLAVDQKDHLAVGAIDTAHDEIFPIGVCRCVRDHEDQSAAEMAITVIDSHQGRGLGTILLAVLAHAARRQGITCFTGSFLAENSAMKSLLAQLGSQFSDSHDGMRQFRMQLHADAEAYPQTRAGSVFRDIFSKLDNGNE